MHPPARLPRLVVVGPLLAALFTTACFLGPGESGSQPPPETTASSSPPALDVGEGAGTDSVAEFRRDITGAQQVAERYWQAQFAAAGLRFEPVRAVVPYERSGELDCGGQPLERNNAAYCLAGDFIAYDINWAYQAFRRIGDAFIYYLLGHEYAHAIQVRLGVRAQFTIQQELQADCMAGAYVGDSARADGLTIEPGDIDEFRRGLIAVGDPPGQPWFAEGSHGTPQQRVRAFANGYERSLGVCDLF